MSSERYAVDWFTTYKTVKYWNIWYYPYHHLRDDIDHSLAIF